MSEFTEQEVEVLKRWAKTSPEQVGERMKEVVEASEFQEAMALVVGKAIEPTLGAMEKSLIQLGEEADADCDRKLKAFNERLQKLEAEMFRRR